MERVTTIAAKVWRVFCTSVCSRVFAALLMCAVTLSMVMGVSSRMRVYTVNEGDTSRVMITLSDAPYLTLEGHDVMWMDPSVEEKEEEDTTLSVEERSIGGLGVFMVKKTMDDVTYEYKDGQNILKIKKNLN